MTITVAVLWCSVGFLIEAWCVMVLMQTGHLEAIIQRLERSIHRPGRPAELLRILACVAFGLGTLIGMVTWPLTLHRIYMVQKAESGDVDDDR